MEEHPGPQPAQAATPVTTEPVLQVEGLRKVYGGRPVVENVSLSVGPGEVVGLLHDFDHIDTDPWPACAGIDGVVVAQAWVAPIERGQHIVVVGREC